MVSPDPSSCDGVVRVSVKGKTLAGNYSGLGTCHNGERISIQLTLVIDELEVSTEWYSESQDPPSSISRCVNTKGPDEFSRYVLAKAMFYPLVDPWGSNAYGSALVNVFSSPEINPEELSVAVPFLIQSLNDPDERTHKAAVNALGNIGPLAKEAIPYIIRCWEEYGGDKAHTGRALNQIAGQGGGSLEDWKKWWSENSEEFLAQ